MKIVTKYDINDTVYFMYHNAVEKGTVVGIRSEYSPRFGYEDYYTIIGERSSKLVPEDNQLFPSKEELLKSL